MEQGTNKTRKRTRRTDDNTGMKTRRADGSLTLQPSRTSLGRHVQTEASSNSSIDLPKSTRRLDSSQTTKSDKKIRNKNGKQSTNSLQIGNYECVVCCRKYPTLFRLYCHKTTEHPEPDALLTSSPREHCAEQFSEREWPKRHKKSKDSVEFTHFCNEDLCGMGFFTRDDLQVHKQNVHDPSLKTYRCTLCDESFFLKYSLLKHVKTHETEQEERMMSDDETEEEEHVMSDKTQKQVKQTKSNSKSDPSTLAYKSDSKPAVMPYRVEGTENPKVYLCTTCDYKCTKKYNIERHVAVKHGDKKEKDQWRKFRCEHPHCKGKYYDQSQLDYHIALMHSGVKNFKCDKCPKYFRSREKLDDHIKKHEKELQDLTKCPHCHKVMSSLRCLEEHIKIVHEKGTGFKCEICGKGFPIRRYYMIHRESHMKKTQCSKCLKVMSTTKALTEHIKIIHEEATDFKCEDCKQGFPTKQYYLAHRRREHWSQNGIFNGQNDQQSEN